MRLLLLFSALVLTAFDSLSQVITFPDSNARWVNRYSEYSNVNPGVPTYTSYEYYCMTSEDTLMNGLSYDVIRDCYTGTYKGATRVDGLKVFFKSPSLILEELLYDFGAQIGDILEVYNSWGQEAIVQDTATEFIAGAMRRVVYFPDPHGFWIEGIGTNRGLFNAPVPNVANSWTFLRCMSYNDTMYWQNEIPSYNTGVCPMDLGLLDPALATPIPYPNPAGESVQFQYNLPIDRIVAINTLGQEIPLTYHSDGAEFTIELDRLDPGLYQILVYSDRLFRMQLLNIGA